MVLLGEKSSVINVTVWFCARKIQQLLVVAVVVVVVK